MSRILSPGLPGGLLSPISLAGGMTAAEEAMVENLQAGDYQNETPSGTVNGANATFTLTAAPSPAASLKLFVNGQLMAAAGVDYTLASATITMVTAPPTGSVIRAWYLRDA